MAAREIAAFDLDGTLTRRDTLLPFLGHIAGRRRLATALVRHSPTLAAAARQRDRRDDAKTAMVGSLLRGRSERDLADAGERFAQHVATRWVRDDVAGRLAWHRDQGHEIVLVTASFAAYAGPLGRHFGASAVVATELEVDGDGRLTGRLAGANCRGEEKVRRLAALYGDPVALAWAYGNSVDDDAMLGRALNAVLVGSAPLVAVPT